MRWIRSWIAGGVPKDRPYVVDDLERLPLANYDYTPLGGIDDDVIVIEWDMALAPEQFEWFEQASFGDGPVVAPYKLYHVAPQPVWAHRRVRLTETHWREDWIHDGEANCDYFGFGLVYLPRKLVREFLDTPALERGRPPEAPGGFFDTRFTDQTFSVWYQKTYARSVPVIWTVRPVHLHSKIAASERH